MKFLLKQNVSYKKEGTIYRVYPNEFSRYIIKEANKRELILETNKIWTGKYYQVNFYEILENDFKRLYNGYKRKIENKRKKFYSRPLLEQLFLILKYIFNRNNRAKEVDMRWARHNAYDDKQEFLIIALRIAANIRNDNFFYGFQEDPGTQKYNYIYYFQFGTKQVSFHSPTLYSNVPKFEGKWNGIRNQKFPFRLR